MLPDMSDTLREWEISVKLKTVTETTVNFVKTRVVTVVSLLAVVQPAEKEKINPDTLDWSKAYKQIHSRAVLNVGQFVEYKGKDYKLVQEGDYQDYGFFEMFAEETKQPLLVATPVATPVVTP